MNKEVILAETLKKQNYTVSGVGHLAENESPKNVEIRHSVLAYLYPLSFLRVEV